MVRELGAPMVSEARDERPANDEVLIEVAGCGVCHTDLGFFYDGVRTRRPLPLTLGHEVSGTVVEAGADALSWLGRSVIVPAVIPCETCEVCLAGRGSICPHQVFPGSDDHGGFSSHIKVPARGLCPVPDLTDEALNQVGIDLSSLSVIADAVSTPYQAILRSGLAAEDLAVFVGAGGVGGFGAQIAAALGAVVVAIDIDADRLDVLARHGASLTLRANELDSREIKKQLRRFADGHGIPGWRQKIFETSGTPRGQATAFRLLGPGGYLSVIGFTPDEVSLRLSNLMAFDAVAQGNWGCLPKHYPAVLELVLRGDVRVAPFIEKRSMDTINETFEELRAHRMKRRPVLIPEA